MNKNKILIKIIIKLCDLENNLVDLLIKINNYLKYSLLTNFIIKMHKF